VKYENKKVIVYLNIFCLFILESIIAPGKNYITDMTGKDLFFYLEYCKLGKPP